MKQLNVGLILLAGIMSSPHALYAECSDTILQLYEAKPGLSARGTEEQPSVTRPVLAGGRRTTIALRCVGGTATIPGMTLIQIYETRAQQLCYRDYSCGNVHSWSAYVGISGSWLWYDSVAKILEDAPNTLSWKTDFNGGSLSAKLAVEWGQIERSCRPLSEAICL
jgi:hypothetical protein